MSKTQVLRRVVVTGLGMVTPLGLDVPSTWQAVLDCRSGIDLIAGWGDLDKIKDKYNLSDEFPFIAGEVKGFNIKDIINRIQISKFHK